MSADTSTLDPHISTISVLPPEIASQIAAGEVVERPGSVVKELVENALDAGARRIAITLEDGGRQLIQVIDDGLGMSPEEARLSVERHATSKIRTAEDLFRIGTYGFRGEALPSIASVSEFELISKRREDEEASRIVVKGGILTNQSSTAAPTGTTIRVSRLFENVPARLKFLKSSQTELQRSIDFVQRLALARPEVSFTLKHAAQENFNHPGGDDITALVSVFGRQVARDLIPVDI
ncbi:MAG: DNA mismatch repair endonuclease MutL, partial [Armatimonadota bacterium]